MKNKIYLIIILLLLSCRTVKKREHNELNNPLESTCWAINYHVRENGDSLKMDLVTNLHFMKDGICSISGMEVTYKYEKNGFYLAGDYCKIIKLSENELKIEKTLSQEKKYYEIYHRINCDSVNDIFKGFYTPENMKK